MFIKSPDLPTQNRYDAAFRSFGQLAVLQFDQIKSSHRCIKMEVKTLLASGLTI